jgi:hypothetical protein
VVPPLATARAPKGASGSLEDHTDGSCCSPPISDDFDEQILTPRKPPADQLSKSGADFRFSKTTSRADFDEQIYIFISVISP